MLTGTIKFFVASKNFGFIIPHEGGKDVPNVFFHGSVFTSPVELQAGMWVQFDHVIDTPMGPRALHVALCEPKKPRRAPEGVKPIPITEGLHASE